MSVTFSGIGQLTTYVIELLSESSLLLLFVVLAVGSPLGKIKIAGINLDIVSILFTGLAFEALTPDIKLPIIIYEIGLVLFIYCIGISKIGGYAFRSANTTGCAGVRQ